MANLRRWSTTATGNATVAGGVSTINFAEGQTPGSVNNSAREMMAQVRGIYTPAEWGWVEHSSTASVASQTSFKLAGNQTTNWTAGRRWRLKSGSSTRYGKVVSSSFTTETTVTVSVDSGSLSASHSLAALSPIDEIGRQIPNIRQDSSGNVAIGGASISGNFNIGDGTDYAILNGGTSQSELFLGRPSSSGFKAVYTAASNKLTIAAGAAVGVGLTPPDVMTLTSTALLGITSDFGIGYGVGAGSTVTQLTSKSTGVTINSMTGAITTTNSTLTASTAVVFQVTNSSANANDTVIVHRVSGGSTGNYIVNTDGIGSGFFNIAVRNMSASLLTDALVIRFTIIKSVNS